MRRSGVRSSPGEQLFFSFFPLSPLFHSFHLSSSLHPQGTTTKFLFALKRFTLSSHFLHAHPQAIFFYNTHDVIVLIAHAHWCNHSTHDYFSVPRFVKKVTVLYKELCWPSLSNLGKFVCVSLWPWLTSSSLDAFQPCKRARTLWQQPFKNGGLTIPLCLYRLNYGRSTSFIWWSGEIC